MMPALGLHEIAQYSALRMVDSLAEGTLIAVFAALVLRATGRRNAATRFAICFLSLVAIAAVPVLSGSWPRTGLSSAAETHPALMLSGAWAVYLFAAWALVSTCLLTNVGSALWHLRRLRKNCVEIALEELHPELRATLLRKQGARRIAICRSEQLRVPTAVGLVNPAIVFPGWTLRELSPAELNQILLHELAHLRRWDDWTNLAQQVVKSMFFFHPAVWWIEKTISLEREIACDDAVLAETQSPRAYAECLAHLAEKSFFQRSIVLAQAALGRLRHTSLRVARILDGNRPAANANLRTPAIALVAVFAIACVVEGSRAPRLIAFQESTPPQVLAQTISVSPNSKAALARIGLADPQRQTAFVTPVSLKVEASHSKLPIIRPRTLALHSHTAPKSNTLIHLAATKQKDETRYTETLVVVFESSQNQQFYQIQMWHVTVWHSAAPSDKAPRKET